MSSLTNAATGTDQNGATFWEKIRANFVRRGASAGRTAISLQNRFNKTIQAEVNKYIGILQGSMREYHSGWAMDDYACDAKKKFQLKFGKQFKHDAVFAILKKSLPKNEINVCSMDARVSRALFFVDRNKQERQHEGAMPTGVVGASTASSSPDEESEFCAQDNNDFELLTPRPTMGKKKAKLTEFNRKQQQNAKDSSKQR